MQSVMAGQPFFESGSKSGWPDFSPDDYPLYLNLENFTYGTKGNGSAWRTANSRDAGKRVYGGGIAPLPFKRGATGSEVPFYNSIADAGNDAYGTVLPSRQTSELTVAEVITQSTSWIKVGLTALFFLVGFVCNVYILLSIGNRKTLEKNSLNWYLLNEAIVNVLFTLTFPVFILEDIFWDVRSLQEPVCLARETVMFMNHFCGVTFLTFLVTVVLDAVKIETNRISNSTTVAPHLATSLIWIVCALTAALAALLCQLASAAMCTTMFTAFSAIVFLVSSGVVCYSFFAVYRCKLHDRKGSGRTDAETNEISPVKEQELRSDSESNIKLAAKNETVVMSGVMAISMLLCCIPLHILRIIGEYTTNDAFSMCGPYHDWEFLLLLSNAAMNPCIWIVYHLYTPQHNENKKLKITRDQQI